MKTKVCFVATRIANIKYCDRIGRMHWDFCLQYSCMSFTQQLIPAAPPSFDYHLQRNKSVVHVMIIGVLLRTKKQHAN